MPWAPPQSPDLSSFHAHQQHHHYHHYQHQQHPAPPQYIPRPMLQSPMPRHLASGDAMHDADYIPDASLPHMSAAPDLPNTDHITIKNHFPVARIKRIMQADDDVGKVAQVTPVVVSKALELFMISLVTKAAAEAKSRNSKRVGSIHLKQAITKTDRFDFLNEIVSKVADAPDKSEADNMEVDGKKKKMSSRKKKKADSDDDF
ncbi:histone-fold-containing protein [Bipolaris maydis]|nr:histone-fold-containing protein [Bipolaris maydis]KAJ6283725.1 histone-fold-containing protein [Bipolaris maydis]